ncbi:DNA (cytosine-5-)-methyltransferase [Apilactobacillus timberlakei]|uniref:Cytosine-specific methyltransferase n=1 Tax=Apilactobacillus timberlakei TaxID=2008380 RepID=A0ABY2YUX6_9LACO|nr:DNA (cytosine-5-)-methyltransferase [Apilactobacillus timberlakei]TPR12923.1 DNA (cytosine-5-)-methyltransferase [Apilactobacillus timberlakei]TPR14894.1 DNA (cytosine-5-)-methyltransferase [Apilactobacillus timberlakei]TPR16225.1 DNA (cytosine-5-)-methyltransferase [Apilactobacillus timberlakei]
MSDKLKVLELFAGVGGFRIGLENADKDLFKTEWSNQYEPSRKSQDAFDVYNYKFPDSENIGIDIADISNEKFQSMDADMIVGGFPCQDYSVARSKKNELGIQGKKGVLFWQIIRAAKQIHPKYMIFENVDRLLKAPAKQRGRDFSVMLTSLNSLGYSVEWRVVNAAEYGRAQRRRRVYFFVFRNDLPYAKHLDNEFENDLIPSEDSYDYYIFKEGLFAKQFPIKHELYKNRKAYYELPEDIVEASDDFSGKVFNTGIMRHGRYYTIDSISDSSNKPTPLKDILQPDNEIDEKNYITDQNKLDKFKYLRGSKRIERTSADGHKYTYSEGGMSPYENLSLPGRTMLTSEGTVNRSTHFLKINDRYRILTPIEAERMQDFPDDWTKYKIVDGEVKEVTDRMRRFFMGNALVTTVIQQIGLGIKDIVNKYDK